jgi:plasmid maintenance system killer protein
MYRILYTEDYNKKASTFLGHHPELKGQYRKCLELLEVDPSHPSLRPYQLKGKLAGLYSVSINITYRITLSYIDG